MNVGLLRTLIKGLPDSAFVIIDADPFPVSILTASQVHGPDLKNMVIDGIGLMLTPEVSLTELTGI